MIEHRRTASPAGPGRHARFQLNPQGYRFPSGHRLKVEVTADDAPYLQPSNIPADVTVDRMSITLPLLGRRSGEHTKPTRAATTASHSSTRWWTVGLPVTAALVIGAGGIVGWRRRRAQRR